MAFNRPYQRLILSLGLSLSWAGFALSMVRAQPDSRSSQLAMHGNASVAVTERGDSATKLLKFLDTAFIPPKKNVPQSTTTSATRDGQRCDPHEPKLKAIAPPGGYALTLDPRPTITLEVAQTSARQVTLLLQDEAGHLHGQAVLPLPKHLTTRNEASEPTHWVGVQVPDSMPALLPNQRYRWSLVVMCGESIQPDDPTFIGWIERREDSVNSSQTLRLISPAAQVAWYAKNGYWYDLVEQAGASGGV